MIKLSVAIISFNEEKNIERCITSVLDLADEIVVIDSYSNDQTEEICLKYRVKFIKNSFAGHIEQKNFAITHTSFDYVLSMDADEAISPKLKESILAIKKNWKGDGYYFNRLNNYVGHWIHHCGWYPDRKLRLWNKNRGCWGGANPHDIVIMNKNSKTGFLKGDLLHYSYTSISDHVEQTNKFTTIAAKAAYERGTNSSSLKAISHALYQFFRDYILKRGFLEGRHGIVICYINALSAFLKYSKILELQRDERSKAL